MIHLTPGNLRIPRFEKPVYVVAGGMTDFRKRYPEKNASELCADAFNMAVRDNDLKVVDAGVQEPGQLLRLLAVC